MNDLQVLAIERELRVPLIAVIQVPPDMWDDIFANIIERKPMPRDHHYVPDSFADRGDDCYPAYRGNVREPDPQRPTEEELAMDEEKDMDRFDMRDVNDQENHR